MARKTNLLLYIKIYSYIFLPSTLGNTGACSCFEQASRFTNKRLISIVSLTCYCCSPLPAAAVPSPQAGGAADPRAFPRRACSALGVGSSGAALPLPAGSRLQPRGLPGERRRGDSHNPAKGPSPTGAFPESPAMGFAGIFRLGFVSWNSFPLFNIFFSSPPPPHPCPTPGSGGCSGKPSAEHAACTALERKRFFSFRDRR